MTEEEIEAAFDFAYATWLSHERYGLVLAQVDAQCTAHTIGEHGLLWRWRDVWSAGVIWKATSTRTD